METKVMLTCRNENREDNGKHYVYDSVLDYAYSEREAFDCIASEILGREVKLNDSQIVTAVAKAYDLDLTSFYGDNTIGNLWKHESVIDFDNPVTPISNGEDIAQSLYNALVAAWEEVA